MKIVRKFPPNWDKIHNRFDLEGINVVFTYGDTLYSPFIDAKNILMHLIKHEETHMRQQGDDPDGWWQQYVDSNLFRLKQEVEAYHNQFMYYCKNKKDLAKRVEFLEALASDLSGKMYGHICTFKEAVSLISTGQMPVDDVSATNPEPAASA